MAFSGAAYGASGGVPGTFDSFRSSFESVSMKSLLNLTELCVHYTRPPPPLFLSSSHAVLRFVRSCASSALASMNLSRSNLTYVILLFISSRPSEVKTHLVNVYGLLCAVVATAALGIVADMRLHVGGTATHLGALLTVLWLGATPATKSNQASSVPKEYMYLKASSRKRRKQDRLHDTKTITPRKPPHKDSRVL